MTLPSGYYTIPPMDELDSIANSSQCNVKGFTVGRRGFGEVHFPGVTDVFGLDLVKLGEDKSTHQLTRAHTHSHTQTLTSHSHTLTHSVYRVQRGSGVSR